MKGFITKSLHVKKYIKDVHGALRMPIYENAAYEFESSEEFSAVSAGKKLKHVYTRSSNPTVEDFEVHVKTLTDSLGVVALGSGMAAIATAIFTLVKAGESIVTTNCLFGHTLSLFQNTLPNMGINIKFVDVLDENSVKNAFDDTVKLLFLETISNPQLQIANLERLSKISHAANVPLMVDTTMTPFYLFDAKRFGVDIEVLSSTKFISGGGTSVGGLIIDHGIFDWQKVSLLDKYYSKAGNLAFIYKARKEIFQNLGTVLSPHNAYLQTLGLETMALRIDRACENSLSLAAWLQDLDGVENVNYPLIKNSPFYDLAKKQFKHAGSVLTFEVAGSEKDAYKFMDRLQIIRRATNLHDNKTLIVSPYFVIYPFNSHEEKVSLGIKPNMMRLSVGIEDVEDLKEDILQALS